jgi:hypothetical protein
MRILSSAHYRRVGSYIQADETPLDVQMHEGRGKNHQGYLWQYGRPGRTVIRLPSRPWTRWTEAVLGTVRRHSANGRLRLSRSGSSRTCRCHNPAPSMPYARCVGSPAFYRVEPALFEYEIESTWSFPGLSRKLSRERWQLCGRRGCSLWPWRPPRSAQHARVPLSIAPPSFRFRRAPDEHGARCPYNPALATLQ